MAVCPKTGDELPERNSHFSGFECKYSKGWNCKYYSHVFSQGTNCFLLRKPINVKAILGIGNRTSADEASEGKQCLNL